MRRFSLALVLAAAIAGPAAAQDHRLDGVWEGAYDCAQGRTGLTLTLDATPTGAVTATFHFWPRQDTRIKASGRFSMRGTIDPQGRLRLEPDRWIDRPDEYAMVGLVGTVYAGQNGDKDVMLGDVTGLSSCSTWAAKRK